MFYFKGISNKKMGVIATEEDFRIKSSMQYEQIDIDGKTGSYYDIKDARKDVVSSFEITILNKNIDDVLQWLDGRGIFEYNKKCAEMLILDVITPMRFGNLKKATVNYVRRPIWRDIDDSFLKCTNFVHNLGNISSSPIIRLKGLGTVEILINGIQFSYNFDKDGEVIIDCEEKIETYNGKSKSRNIKIGYEYPKLDIGMNKIEIIKGNAEIYIKRRNAYI